MDEGAENQELSETFGGLVYDQGYLCIAGGRNTQRMLLPHSQGICGLDLAYTEVRRQQRASHSRAIESLVIPILRDTQLRLGRIRTKTRFHPTRKGSSNG